MWKEELLQVGLVERAIETAGDSEAWISSTRDPVVVVDPRRQTDFAAVFVQNQMERVDDMTRRRVVQC